MFHVLFLCTHNRCRSILCEVIANHLAEGVIRASSAGSEPAGAVHPMTLQHLERRGYPTLGVRSKSMEEFSGGFARPHGDGLRQRCRRSLSRGFERRLQTPLAAHRPLEIDRPVSPGSCV